MQGESENDTFKSRKRGDKICWNGEIPFFSRESGKSPAKETGFRVNENPPAFREEHCPVRSSLRAEGAGWAATGIAVGRDRAVDGAHPLLPVLRGVEETVGTGRHGSLFSPMPREACLQEWKVEAGVSEGRALHRLSTGRPPCPRSPGWCPYHVIFYGVGGAVIIVAIIPDFDTIRFVFLNFLFMPSSGIPHPLTLLPSPWLI